MQSPFPGMDPYLERPSLWPDVHHRLITAICDQIQSQIVPRYVAVITPYVAFESLEITPVRVAIPDVGIYERNLPGDTNVAVAIAPAPVTRPSIMQIPTRYGRVEIRTVGDETLVTAIEVLSPVNKRPSADGADAYEKKRQELYASTAHLLEIDLLRAGRRPLFAQPLPEAPYFIYLSRVQRRPTTDIWPLSLRTSIPIVPVPLRYPDGGVPLDLTKVLQQIYANARYDVQVNYREAPPAPDLAPEDIAWLDAHLRERGLRS